MICASLGYPRIFPVSAAAPRENEQEYEKGYSNS